jgi:6-bladed beta-propeller
MKRLFISLIVISFLASCGDKQPKVDKVFQDGVEVVLNHAAPYLVPGEPAVLSLEMEFAIDAEDQELLAAGLTDIRQFGVDSEGSIYIAQRPRKDASVIYKFDGQGRLLGSFGTVGQGPGEMEQISYFGVNSRGEIFNLDARRNTVTTFSSFGELRGQIRLAPALRGAIPLDNGNFVAAEDEVELDIGFEEMTWNLLDARSALVKMLHRFRFPIQVPGPGTKPNAFLPSPVGTFTPDRIFLGMPGKGYEILVFDLGGTLLRKIRKEYEPVEVSSGYREESTARLPQGSPVAGQLFFPDHRLAFQYLFADEAGRLFVMTSEKDETTGQNTCDIFNEAGVFIGRAAIGYYDRFRQLWEGMSLDVVAKNKRFYVLHEKEDGYKELVVYKAIWR